MLLVDPVAELGRCHSQLCSRVYTFGFHWPPSIVDDDRPAFGDEHADRVGEVELTLHVVRLEPVEHGPEAVRTKDIDRGVDLSNGELLGRCVARLDDPQ